MEGRIRGESLSTRPRGTSELAGVADRAGSIVRDQISSMTEAARSTAADIERTARDSADDTRREAVESAVRTVGNINQVERELTLLLRGVSQEADALRAKLDRVRLLSSPLREPAGGRLEVSGGEHPAEARLLSPGLERAEEEPPVDMEVEAETEAESAPVFTEAAAQPPLPEAAVETPPVEESLEEPSAEAGEEEKAEQAPEGESAAESLVEAGPEGASEPDSEAEEPAIAELELEEAAELELEEADPETAVSPDSTEPSDPGAPEEGRGFRGKIEKLLLPSAPVRDPDGRFEAAGAEHATEAAPLTSGPEQAQDPPLEMDLEVEAAPAEDGAPPPLPEAAVVAPSVEGSPEADSAEPGEDEKSEPSPEESTDPSARPTLDEGREDRALAALDEGREERALAGLFGGAGSASPTLDEEGLRRVAEKSDLELGELYVIAADRAAASSNDDDRVYWGTLERAIVEESLGRPDFGRPPQGGAAGGRKAKKRRSKALNPLTAAREEALAQRGENAGPL